MNNSYILSAVLSTDDKWLMFIKTTQIIELDVDKPMLIIPKNTLDKMVEDRMVKRNIKAELGEKE